MNTRGLFNRMQSEILGVKHDADRFAARVAANTIDASVLQNGIRENGFEVRTAILQLLWDASGATDIPAKAAAGGYDLSVAEFAERGIEVAQWVATPIGILNERNRSKMVALFRADLEDNLLAVAPALAALKTSLQTAIDFANANYPEGLAGEDLGRRLVTVNGKKRSVAVVYAAGEMALLGPILVDVSAKAAALMAVIP